MRKQLAFSPEQLGQLEPFTRLVGEFLSFITPKIGKPLGEDELAEAAELENRIDAWRAELKKSQESA